MAYADRIDLEEGKIILYHRDDLNDADNWHTRIRRPDGKGYPDGLTGDEIPLMASIVSLADFYEALSSKRPYKEPWAIENIVTEIARVRGQQFPEEVVDALFAVLEDEGLMAREDINKAIKSQAA